MLWLLPAMNKKYDYSKFPPHGWLVAPSGGVAHLSRTDNRFGVDNDAFGGKFNRDKYLRLLDNVMQYKARCLFVNPPDVVGSIMETSVLYDEWYDEITGRGLPISYVLQDGLCQLPKRKPKAIFVGGSTEFKLSQTVLRFLEIVRPDYWIHIGRVNTLKRLLHFRYVADSFDGTQCYRFGPDIGTKYMRGVLEFMDLQQELGL